MDDKHGTTLLSRQRGGQERHPALCVGASLLQDGWMGLCTVRRGVRLQLAPRRPEPEPEPEPGGRTTNANKQLPSSETKKRQGDGRWLHRQAGEHTVPGAHAGRRRERVLRSSPHLAVAGRARPSLMRGRPRESRPATHRPLWAGRLGPARRPPLRSSRARR